jgi:hypothetical protein
MTEEKLHEIPLEPESRPGKRSGEGAMSILTHLQQQVQSKPPSELDGEPGSEIDPKKR